MPKVGLLLAILLLWASSASAQYFNALAGAPYSGSFGASPLPFFTQNAAINYNRGGQGLAYNVPSPGCSGASCAAGSVAYRPDAINFKASTFGAGFNYQLGFSASPNSYNYTVNISQPGPFIITLWLADSSPGGSWNILIDGQLVGNVVTPNTGDHSIFAASSSAAFSATIGTHVLTLGWGSGDTQFAGSGDIVAWQGGVVSGNSVVCDIGPPYMLQTGSGYTNGIPTAADAAGYRTCVNYDFGSSAYANVSSWLGCSTPGVSFNTTPGFQWYHDAFAESSDVNQIAPCDVTIANDTAPGGGTALRMNWAQSSWNGTNKMLIIQTYTHSNTQITDFPNGTYYEMVARLSVSPPPACSGVCDPAAFWTWTTGGTGGPEEQDFVLFDNSPLIQAIWVPGGPFFTPAITYNGLDVSVYHKYGYRVTSDPSTSALTICSYLDDAFQACRAVPIGGNPSAFTMRHSPILQIGAMNATVQMWVKYARMWTCANWKTQECNEPVLNGPP